MSDTERCADICRALNEPLAGTGIDEARFWLLVEDRSAWERKAFKGADRGFRTAIEALGDALEGLGDTRLQAIRRPDRSKLPDDAPLTVYVVDAETRVSRRTEVPGAELDAVDVVAMAEGRAGDAVDDAVVLVCMHARRDKCCARMGAPVFLALEAEERVQAWHTTHVGGHRFAANVVTLPGGLCYGFVEADDVPALVAAELSGEVFAPATRLRGDARYSSSVQSADAWLRSHIDEPRRDALRFLDVEKNDQGIRIVTFDTDDGRWRVPVRKTRLEPARVTSCDKDEKKSPKAYRVLADAVVRV